MASSITGYRSPVDLQLGQVPKTTDPTLFNEMTDIYNAIHLLNQYLDQLRITAEGGGGSGVSPADSMPFNRFYTTTALVNVLAGDVVSPSPVTGQDGVIKGALSSDISSTTPSSNFAGVALGDALAGTQVTVGVGPAILTVPAATSGQLLWAYSSRAVDGSIVGDATIYTGNPGPKAVGSSTAYPMPVATCPRTGFALFGPFLARVP